MEKTCSTRTRPRPRPTSRSWYVCSFCRRDFSSAQALGGHMNVHRRDRARLLLQYSPPSSSSRLSPPSDSSHDSTDVVDDHHRPSTLLAFPAETSVLLMPPSHKLKKQLAEEHQEEQLEKVARLELGMGMEYYCKQQQLQDPLMAAPPKPTLDLELRLGCSFTSI